LSYFWLNRTTNSFLLIGEAGTTQAGGKPTVG
jgi:hypothetical protein